MNETPIYTVFYDNYKLELVRADVVANDHEDALSQVTNLADCKEVRLIFLGVIPEAIWHG